MHGIEYTYQVIEIHTSEVIRGDSFVFWSVFYATSLGQWASLHFSALQTCEPIFCADGQDTTQ